MSVVIRIDPDVADRLHDLRDRLEAASGRGISLGTTVRFLVAWRGHPAVKTVAAEVME